MEEQQHEHGHGPGVGAPPKGWSSLTRLHRNPSPPRDPFPPLTKNNSTHSSSACPPLTVVPTTSPELDRSQQTQGVSPASSTGSFSSSNTTFAPESSSGSRASSAGGSLSLSNLSTSYRVQSSAQSTTLHGGSHTRNGRDWGGSRSHNWRDWGGSHFRHDRDLDLSGGGQSDEKVEQAADCPEGLDAYRSALKKNLPLSDHVNENRRNARESADRDGLDVNKPAVSDGRSSIRDPERDANDAHEQAMDGNDSTVASSDFDGPVKTAREEEGDLYYRVRYQALKESRARDKFARGATQAHVRGDHRKARTMSKQAQEKRVIAEKLHAEAAVEILKQRNRNGLMDIWHLDLHGLHSAEAVAALESRLALLEHGLVEGDDGRASHGRRLIEDGHDQIHMSETQEEWPTEAGATRSQDCKQKLFQSLVQSSKLLSIVTGVGAHSQGGATLPSAVKSFLINSGYQLEEPRAGVVYVRPKLRFSV